jgi:DNA repair exonuclease SbcCD ATPase subunit
MSPQVRAGEVPDSYKVSQLLSQAKTQAYQLKEDASALQSFVGSATELQAQSHAVVLNQIKDHVNTVGRQLAQLEQNSTDASPWQKTAIERIRPLLQELASNTTNVINRLNQHPNQLRTGAYKDYVEANADLAAQLSEMIADFVDYGKTKNRFERLGDKLEISGTDSQ